jgi:predicted nucleic acid-binding protein
VILVDTSIWIYFWKKRSSTDALSPLLEHDEVLVHELVMAELAVGNLGPAHVRDEILSGLQRLPRAPVAELNEVLTLIRTQRLERRGLGAVDAHLLASARLAAAQLWTTDKALASAADECGLLFALPL